MQRRDERLQQGEVRGALDPVGVAREVRRLRQRRESESEPEAGVATEWEGVRHPTPARTLEQTSSEPTEWNAERTRVPG